ncbi:hypothetical protein OHS33_11410 [Streptomyces sp. NBC_00536]|uniref:hypothetical protein n=1 Tax=Streptomyces sp. NBC_00536 TaxID=2975769 RepID=UPI002E820856|nr:hypothetical protein [Streptomyces sp. NBC_00536]WUC78888.1 hypothetical protein OHS33_11410 [Streptomyces sp. NBC_00536]
MTRPPRRLSAALLCACALAVGGCATPGGLASGEPAPPVSPQPRPEPLWPAWTEHSDRAPGVEVSTKVPPPQPLENGPEVPEEGGLKAMNHLEILRADPLMRAYAYRGPISAPGRAGIRPPVYQDLTGDGRQELIAAADTESGRSVLTVYTVVKDRVVPIMFTTGLRMEVEAMGTDLLVRTNTDEGIEQAARFRWDGARMTVVSEEKRYSTSAPALGSGWETRK